MSGDKIAAASSHHPTLSPSSLPAIYQCPKYVPGHSDDDDAKRGTLQHKYLAQLLTAPERTALLGLSQEEREAVEWAYEYIQAHTSSDAPLEVEKTLSLIGEDFEEITYGTPDVFSAPHLFDYKSGEVKFYLPQLAAYAWMELQAHPELKSLKIHILYGRFQRADTCEITLDEAKSIVLEVMQKQANQSLPPNPCEFCKYCGALLTCPEIAKGAAEITAGRSDWNLETYHASEIQKPEEMARALSMARNIKEWCESVEYHARIMAKKGITLPGWKASKRKGAREVKDILKCFDLCGLSPGQFLGCCKVLLGELEEQYGVKNSLKKAAAAKQLETLLKDVVERRPPTIVLTREKEKAHA